MGLQEMIERDVLTVVSLGAGMSYSEVCEMLGAYDRMAVIGAVNRLNASGSIRLADSGFVLGSSDAVGDDSEVGSDPIGELSEGSFVPANDEVALPELESEVDKEEGGDTLHEGASLAAEVGDACERRQSVLLPGTVLNSTSIELLGLEDEAMEAVRTLKIQTVFELVHSLGDLLEVLRPKAVARVIKRLVGLSGEPAVALDDAQIRSLEDYALSSCFFFDWFGVLCTRLSPKMDVDEIKAFIKEGGLSRKCRSKFDLAKFEKGRPDDVVAVVSTLRAALARFLYPLNGNSLNILMVPVVQEWFDNGECESQQEALEMALEYVTTRPQTESACFGYLRDKFERIRQRAEAGEKVGPLGVANTSCFTKAAERLEQCDSYVNFDSQNRRLYYADKKSEH